MLHQPNSDTRHASGSYLPPPPDRTGSTAPVLYSVISNPENPRSRTPGSYPPHFPVPDSMPRKVDEYKADLLPSTPGSADSSSQFPPLPLLCSVCLTVHDDRNDFRSDARLLPTVLPSRDDLPYFPPEEKMSPAHRALSIPWIIPSYTHLVRHQMSGQLSVPPAVPALHSPDRSLFPSLFPATQSADTVSRSLPARFSSRNPFSSSRSGLCRYVTLCKREQKKTAATSATALSFVFN